MKVFDRLASTGSWSTGGHVTANCLTGAGCRTAVRRQHALTKLLGLDVAPQLLAGLLYLGSGVGLALLMLVRHLLMRGRAGQAVSLHIPAKELPWLAVLGGGWLDGRRRLATCP